MTSTRCSPPALPPAFSRISPGFPVRDSCQEFATGGSLKPLDDVLDIATYKSETAPALVSLGTVDNKIYGVFIKAAVKGLMWYNPKVVNYADSVPATWDDLTAALKTNASKAQAQWCLGIESGAASGLAGHRLDRGLRPAPVRP